MLDNIANGLLHIGWALWGQSCSCGYSKFNWLANVLEGTRIAHSEMFFKIGDMLTRTALWMERTFKYVNL